VDLIISNIKKETFENLTSLKAKVKLMNEKFGDECIDTNWSEKGKYVKLYCKYKGCVF